MLQKKVEFKDFSRLLSDFPVLFKADLIFKDPLNSSTFQACANPAPPPLKRKKREYLSHVFIKTRAVELITMVSMKSF